MRRKNAEKPMIAMTRALWYHLYPGLWTDFFSRLGFRVQLSGETVRATVERAALISESEHCLPLKLHDAHLDEIAGEAERIFIPRILSTLPRHIACPKLGALPDCACAQFGDDTEIITVEVNEAEFPLRRSLMRLGRRLGCRRRLVRSAAGEALKTMHRNRAEVKAKKQDNQRGFFLILGHPYNLHDAYMAQPILNKLDNLNAGWQTVDYSATDVEPVLIKWDACSIMYDSIAGLDPQRCRGVIQLSSFNCGCDSVAMQMFRRLLKEKNIPYLTIILDENEAQAGIDTRLEAFVDSVQWRNNKTFSKKNLKKF